MHHLVIGLLVLLCLIMTAGIILASTSRTVCCEDNTFGSVMNPLLNRFTPSMHLVPTNHTLDISTRWEECIFVTFLFKTQGDFGCKIDLTRKLLESFYTHNHVRKLFIMTDTVQDSFPSHLQIITSPIWNTKTESRWVGTMSKLKAFLLDAPKVVWLDHDQIILGNIEDLCDEPTLALAYDTRDFKDVLKMTSGYGISSVVVLNPATDRDAVRLYLNQPLFSGDQEVLHRVFRGRFRRLRHKFQCIYTPTLVTNEDYQSCLIFHMAGHLDPCLNRYAGSVAYPFFRYIFNNYKFPTTYVQPIINDVRFLSSGFCHEQNLFLRNPLGNTQLQETIVESCPRVSITHQKSITKILLASAPPLFLRNTFVGELVENGYVIFENPRDPADAIYDWEPLQIFGHGPFYSVHRFWV